MLSHQNFHPYRVLLHVRMSIYNLPFIPDRFGNLGMLEKIAFKYVRALPFYENTCSHTVTQMIMHRFCHDPS